MNGCFFAKCKISFYQMKKAIRDYLLLHLNLINHKYELDNLIIGRIV